MSFLRCPPAAFCNRSTSSSNRPRRSFILLHFDCPPPPPPLASRQPAPPLPRRACTERPDPIRPTRPHRPCTPTHPPGGGEGGEGRGEIGHSKERAALRCQEVRRDEQKNRTHHHSGTFCCQLTHCQNSVLFHTVSQPRAERAEARTGVHPPEGLPEVVRPEALGRVVPALRHHPPPALDELADEELAEAG